MSENDEKLSDGALQPTGKRPYRKPEVSAYGRMRDLTATGTSTQTEQAGMGTQAKMP